MHTYIHTYTYTHITTCIHIYVTSQVYSIGQTWIPWDPTTQQTVLFIEVCTYFRGSFYTVMGPKPTVEVPLFQSVHISRFDCMLKGDFY